MIKCILLDFDGTIVDTNEIIIDALTHAVRETSGKTLDTITINSVFGLILEEQMKVLAPNDYINAMERYKNYYREHMDDMTKLFPNAKMVLEELKNRDIKLGIVSNKGTNGINHGLIKFDIKNFFDVVISAYDVLHPKPHPEGIYNAMNALNVLADETLFIGDSPHDILSGENAGVKTVLVDWTIFPPESFKNSIPDYMINDFTEILTLIL